MTANIPNPYPDKSPPWYRKHWVHLVGVGIIALFFGIGAGAGAQPEGETVVVAGPQVTLTPEPEPAVTVTSAPETTEVEVTSADCLDALNAADDFIVRTGDLIGGTVASMFDAASRFDADELNRLVGVFEDEGDDLLVTQAWYLSAREACRG